MPRASLNPDKAKQGGAVEAGNYLCTAAKFQNLKSFDGKVVPHLVLDMQPIDKSGDPIRDADTTEIRFGFGGESANHYEPGTGKSIDDADPRGNGKDIDVEGNTIYTDDANSQLSASCSAVVFMKSLAKLGYPDTVLDACWGPSFVGMKVYLANLPAGDVNKLIGTRLNTKPGADGAQFPYKVAQKWLNPDYLGKDGLPTNGGKSSASNGTTAAASNGAASAPAAGAAGGTMSVADVVKACMAKLAAKQTGKSIDKKASLIGFLSNEFSTGFAKVGVKLPEFRAVITNDEALTEAIIAAGGNLTYNDEGAWSGATSF